MYYTVYMYKYYKIAVPGPRKYKKYKGNIMHYKTILTALVETLGGCGDGLEEELNRMFDECPNMALLCADFMRNGAMLAQEVTDLNSKCELLKECLVQNRLLVKAPGSDSSEVDEVSKQQRQYIEEAMAVSPPSEEDEIRINDIVWHLACDEENPN